MKHRIKLLLAILLLTAALPMKSSALSLISMDRDFTVSIAGRTFGFSGYSTIPVTYVDYCFGTWKFQQPFHVVVSAFALIPICGLAASILALRRRRDKPA